MFPPSILSMFKGKRKKKGELEELGRKGEMGRKKKGRGGENRERGRGGGKGNGVNSPDCLHVKINFIQIPQIEINLNFVFIQGYTMNLLLEGVENFVFIQRNTMNLLLEGVEQVLRRARVDEMRVELCSGLIR